MNLHHLEWLIGEPVPDPEMVVYEMLPYAPVQSERIIERLCVLAGLDGGQADDAQIAALVRLLARQAAREHLHRLAHPDTKDSSDEG